ncbi:hypothetical protein EYS14_11810 [Alteromonadaceae bacterium M269]|nr:hypothetical protein EYS14_11810 [Alteromonadaceae bacterium M269]
MLKYLGDRKILTIRGSEAETGDMSNEAQTFVNEGCGELFNVPGATHTDMYHIEEKVDSAVEKLVSFFNETINK